MNKFLSILLCAFLAQFVSAYDFLYASGEDNLWSRNIDAFAHTQGRVLRSETELPTLTSTDEATGDVTVYTEYGGKKWVCSDGTITPTEAERVAAKKTLLKMAENGFLLAIITYNAQQPEEAQIAVADGFIEIDAKVSRSNLDAISQVRFGLKLRNLWDVVLYHGGRFGDVQLHLELLTAEQVQGLLR